MTYMIHSAGVYPAELVAVPQWVCWQEEEIGGRMTKPPYSPHGGRASVNNPLTWSDFDTAFAAAEHSYNGQIGFVVTDGDSFGVIDLDHCRNPETGEITARAFNIIMIMGSYSEISPSGEGIHIWVRLTKPGTDTDEKRTGNYEMYRNKRYITFTGDHLSDTPLEVDVRDAEWDFVHDMLFSKPPVTEPPASTHRGVVFSEETDPTDSPHYSGLSDDEIIEKARRASNGPKFIRLFDKGDTRDYKGDESAADIGLLRIIIFYTGPDDRDQIERIFSKSELSKRDKWQYREDYRNATIQRAIKDQKVFFGDVTDMVALSSDPSRVNETEVGNAHRLHRRYGHSIHYVSELGKYGVWDDGLWRIGDADLVKRLSLEVVRDMYKEAAEADGERRQAILRHANKSETKRGIDAMTYLVRLLPEVSISSEAFDADPWLLNVANGTIDLVSGNLRAPDRADRLTKRVPIVYDPDAKCPVFISFLERVVPDEEMRSFLQRAVGYSLTGDVREQVLFFLYGEGKNGKSTFTTVIEALLGDMWTKTRSDILMVSRFGASQGATPELAQLKGKRLVTITEISAGALLNEALIKDMTGGDRISARSLYAEPITFAPTHKVWLYGNHKPNIRGIDEGIWRRVRLIPFAQKISPEERDRTLPDKLTAELPGILNWAVEGCLAWQQKGLGEPQEIMKATQEYRDEMDFIGQFVTALCEQRPDFEVGSTELYHVYKQYCLDAGEFPKTHTTFSLAMKERGYGSHRITKGIYFQGLRLRPLLELPTE